MSIVFYSDNLVRNALITGSTENAQFPTSNINDDRRTKVFRSTSNSDNVVFDLGSIEDIDSVCLSPNWRDGYGFISLTVEANGVDEWSSPAFTQVLTYDAKHGISITDFASTQTYRFWRFVMTSSLGYCELANVFIGRKLDISTNGIVEGLGYRNTELVKKSTTEYGQEFYDLFGQRRELDNVRYESMNVTELTQFMTVYDEMLTTKPFWVRFTNPNGALDTPWRYSGLYKFAQISKVTFAGGGFYAIPFALSEQM